MVDTDNTSELWDAPQKDYRQRYELPDQFLWDLSSLARIDFDGYISVVLSMLPQAPAQILDAGCGPGLGAKILVEKGYQVTGVDYNERGIAFAKILVPQATFFHQDLRLLDKVEEFQNSFDVVTIVEVLEHIPPQYHLDVLKGVHSALHFHGKLLISVPSDHTDLNTWDYKHYSLEEVSDLITGMGFKITSTVYQHRIHWLFSGRTWRFLNNQYYDLRFIRSKLRRLFLTRYNTTNDPSLAGRYIICAEKI